MGLTNKPKYVQAKPEPIDPAHEERKTRFSFGSFDQRGTLKLTASTEEELQKKLEAKLKNGWEQSGKIIYNPPEYISIRADVRGRREMNSTLKKTSRSIEKSGQYIVHVVRKHQKATPTETPAPAKILGVATRTH